jgi:lysophospholipase L1-like esterase
MNDDRGRTFAIAALIPPATATAADEPDYVPRQPLAKLDLKDGDTVVFLGDSITHQCLYTQYVEDYFYTRFPKMRLRLHNAGVGGARAWDALWRFEQDIASYKPKCVTVLLGMNDGRYAEYFDDVFTDYSKNMMKLLDEIKKTGATAILLRKTPATKRKKTPGRRQEKNAWNGRPSERSQFGNTEDGRRNLPDQSAGRSQVHNSACNELVIGPLRGRQRGGRRLNPR